MSRLKTADILDILI